MAQITAVSEAVVLNPTCRIVHFACLPTNTRVLTYEADGWLHFWNVDTGKESVHLRTQVGLGEASCKLSPNGEWFVATTATSIDIYRVSGILEETRPRLGRQPLAGSVVSRPAWSPDSARVAVGVAKPTDGHTFNSFIVIVNVSGSNHTTDLPVTNLCRDKQQTLAWSSDGLLLACRTVDGEVKIFSGQQLLRTIRAAADSEHAIFALFWLPGRHVFVTNDHLDGNIKYWDADADEDAEPLGERAVDDAHFVSVEPSPDRQWLACGNVQQNCIEFVNIGDNTKTYILPVAGQPQKLDWMANGRKIAVCDSSKIRIYDVPAGVMETVGAAPAPDGQFKLKWHSNVDGDIEALDSSPDGQWLAVAMDDGTIRVRNAATGAHVRMLAPGGCGSVVAWSKDGARLACVGAHQTLTTWSAASGECLSTAVLRNDGDITTLCWSPTAPTTIAVGYDDNCTIDLVDVATGGRRIVDAIYDNIAGLDWSRDGRRLAAIAAGGAVIIVNTEAGGGVKEMCGATNDADDRSRVIRWSPDARFLATTACERKINVWIMDDDCAKPRTQKLAARTAVWTIDWSPSSQWLAYSDTSGKVHLWNAYNYVTRVIEAFSDEMTSAVVGVRWLANYDRSIVIAACGGIRRYDNDAFSTPVSIQPLLVGPDVRLGAELANALGMLERLQETDADRVAQQLITTTERDERMERLAGAARSELMDEDKLMAAWRGGIVVEREELVGLSDAGFEKRRSEHRARTLALHVWSANGVTPPAVTVERRRERVAAAVADVQTRFCVGNALDPPANPEALARAEAAVARWRCVRKTIDSVVDLVDERLRAEKRARTHLNKTAAILQADVAVLMQHVPEMDVLDHACALANPIVDCRENAGPEDADAALALMWAADERFAAEATRRALAARKREAGEAAEGPICCICQERPCAISLRPCLHLVFCNTCFCDVKKNGTLSKGCPQCRSAVEAALCHFK